MTLEHLATMHWTNATATFVSVIITTHPIVSVLEDLKIL